MSTINQNEKLFTKIQQIIDARVRDLSDEFDTIPGSEFVGTNQWLIRCNGESIWVSCETSSTYFSDSNTMSSGQGFWGKPTDMDDEEFAKSCKQNFPQEAVEERVAKYFLQNPMELAKLMD